MEGIRGRDPGLTGRPVRWEEFKQRCRAHHPEQLLLVLAAMSAAEFDGTPVSPKTAGWNPWAVAAVVRESLAYGSVHRAAPVTQTALRRLLDAHNDLDDPFMRSPDASPWDLILRTMYRQFGWLDSVFNDLARFAALFDRAFASDRYEVLSREALGELLHAPLLDFQAVTFLATVAAQRNQGLCDLTWFDRPHFEPVTEVVSADSIRRVFRQSFTAPLATLAARARSGRNADPELRVHDFNPLVDTPYVGLTDDVHVAPLPRLVADKASVASLYHRGREAWKDRFTRDLGVLIETYVGEQLALVPDGVLTPEREYKPGTFSVDWILDLPDVTVLIEVKSARVAQPGRLTVPAFVEDVNRDVGKAFGQLSRTAALIRAAHPAFTDIPADRQLRGLVVTAEPHYLINSPILREGLPESTIPTSVLSLAELEHTVAFSLVLDAQRVFDRITDWEASSPVNINNTFIEWNKERGVVARPRNPLLDEAWNRLPWNDVTGDKPAE